MSVEKIKEVSKKVEVKLEQDNRWYLVAVEN
jgi:hypothetical protein